MIFEFSKQVVFFAIFCHLGVLPPLGKTSMAPSPFLGPNPLPEKSLVQSGTLTLIWGTLVVCEQFEPFFMTEFVKISKISLQPLSTVGEANS